MSNKFGPREWIAAIAVGLSIAGVIFYCGLLNGELRSVKRRVTDLEVLRKEDAGQMSAVLQTLARIETILEERQ